MLGIAAYLQVVSKQSEKKNVKKKILLVSTNFSSLFLLGQYPFSAS